MHCFKIGYCSECKTGCGEANENGSDWRPQPAEGILDGVDVKLENLDGDCSECEIRNSSGSVEDKEASM